jgi:diaminopimelate decarboxylase
LLFESGRFLAGPAGALVTRVVDVKTIGGRRFVLLDGGINTSGLFGGGNGVRGLSHSVIRDGAVRTGGSASNICGPLCTPMDRLATSVACPAKVGDLVVWWNMGAYGFTAAPVNFLSFPAAAEVLV